MQAENRSWRSAVRPRSASVSSRVAAILARRSEINYSPTDDDNNDYNRLSVLEIFNSERKAHLRRSPASTCTPSAIVRRDSRSFIPIAGSSDNKGSKEIWFSDCSRGSLRYFEHDLNILEGLSRYSDQSRQGSSQTRRQLSPFYISDYRRNFSDSDLHGPIDFTTDDILPDAPVVNSRVPAGAEKLFNQTEPKKKKKKAMNRNWNRGDWQRGGGNAYHGRPPPGSNIVPGRLSAAGSSIVPGRLPPGSSIVPGRLPPGSSIVPGRMQPGSSIVPGRQQPGSSIVPGRQQPGSSIVPGRQQPGSSIVPGRLSSGSNMHCDNVQPVWKIRKVMNERDMDSFDDDVRPSRISRRSSPPPEWFAEPPRQQNTPFGKHGDTARTEDVAIFQNVVERTWDASSEFLEGTPVKRGSFPLYLPGLNSDDLQVDEKPAYSISRNKAEHTPGGVCIKEEIEQTSFRGYTIPGLDLENMDDEDKFLYGDERSECTNVASRPSGSNLRSSSNSIPVNERMETESNVAWNAGDDKPASQVKEDQARLESFLKNIGLNVDSNKQGQPQCMSKDIAQRGAEVAQTLMKYFNAIRNESNTANSPNADRLPVKTEPADTYENYTCSSTAAFPQQSPAPAPLPTYPTYSPYETYYNTYQQPVQQPVTQQHGSLPPAHYQPYSVDLSMVSATPPVVRASQKAPAPKNRSNLKVIPLQASSSLTTTSSPENKKPIPTKAAVPIVASSSVEEVKMPTTVEERKRLRQSQAQLKKKLHLLMEELERLRVQKAELMRKKHRQKDGRNDPMLAQNNSVQEDIKRQVHHIKKDLGLMEEYLTKSLHLTGTAHLSSGDSTPKGAEKSSVRRAEDIVSKEKPSNESKSKSSLPSKDSSQASASQPSKPKSSVVSVVKQYRFIDSGDHWCKHCSNVFPLATDLLKHLHRKHAEVMKPIAPADRPWATKPKESNISGSSEELALLPFKGVEFMLPCQAYFCNLCKEFSGDVFAARNHLESEKHNTNYSKFCRNNPNYMKRITVDRNASLAQKKESKRKGESSKNTKSSKRLKTVLSEECIKREPANEDFTKEKAVKIAISDRSVSCEASKVTKGNIKLNLVKEKSSPAVDSTKISKKNSSVPVGGKPGAKIPMSSTKGVISVTELESDASNVMSSPSTDQEQRKSSRILSNVLKKVKMEKAERTEGRGQPPPLEEFVCIATASPSNDKADTTITTECQETPVRVTPKLPTPQSPKNKDNEVEALGPQLSDSDLVDSELEKLNDVVEAICLPPELEDDLAKVIEESVGDTFASEDENGKGIVPESGRENDAVKDTEENICKEASSKESSENSPEIEPATDVKIADDDPTTKPKRHQVKKLLAGITEVTDVEKKVTEASVGDVADDADGKVMNDEDGNMVVDEVEGESVDVEDGDMVVDEVEGEPVDEEDGEVVDEVEGDLVDEADGEVEREPVDEVDDEVVDEVEGEPVDEADGEVVDEVEGELVDEADGEVVDEVEGDLVDEVDGEVVDEVEGDLVDEADGEVVDEVEGDLVDEADDEVVDEADGDVEEELVEEAEDEIDGEMEGEVMEVVDEAEGEVNELEGEADCEVVDEAEDEVVDEIANEAEDAEVDDYVLTEVLTDDEVLGDDATDVCDLESAPEVILKDVNSEAVSLGALNGDEVNRSPSIQIIELSDEEDCENVRKEAEAQHNEGVESHSIKKELEISQSEGQDTVDQSSLVPEFQAHAEDIELQEKSNEGCIVINDDGGDVHREETEEVCSHTSETITPVIKRPQRAICSRGRGQNMSPGIVRTRACSVVLTPPKWNIVVGSFKHSACDTSIRASRGRASGSGSKTVSKGDANVSGDVSDKQPRRRRSGIVARNRRSMASRRSRRCTTKKFSRLTIPGDVDITEEVENLSDFLENQDSSTDLGNVTPYDTTCEGFKQEFGESSEELCNPNEKPGDDAIGLSGHIVLESMASENMTVSADSELESMNSKVFDVGDKKCEEMQTDVTEEKLDDLLLEDEDTLELPPISEAEEKLDDALLNDSPNAAQFDEDDSNICLGSDLEVVDEAEDTD